MNYWSKGGSTYNVGEVGKDSSYAVYNPKCCLAASRKIALQLLMKPNILSPYNPTVILLGLYSVSSKGCPHKLLPTDMYSNFIYS